MVVRLLRGSYLRAGDALQLEAPETHRLGDDDCLATVEAAVGIGDIDDRAKGLLLQVR
ncbi:MAG: hypothetical protein AW07_00856 [Candidatus Accumulibacter sp. SK-11]|nr:MAG: hypothetical protein AW07_00856 [Candidatus Accumulibacter sp. SK-11]